MAQRQISAEIGARTGIRSDHNFAATFRSKTRSVTRTVRLNQDIEDDLLQHAQKEGLSANVVVNQALRRYLSWEVPSERFGFVAVPASTLTGLFDAMTEEEARLKGREEGYSQATEFVTFFFKKFDLEATLRSLEMLGPMYGKGFEFENQYDGRHHTLVLRHNRGPNTSAYYAEALKAVFDRLGMKAETTETDEQLTVTVQGSNWLQNC